MIKPKLILIDATAFCYRAFYALRNLSTSFGQPTGAVYGFVNILNKILKENNPEYIGACFDVSRETFRQKKFAEYKIQRPPMPNGLSSQIPLIKQIISAYGIPIFEKEGFEADDLIASLAQKAKKEGLSVIIVSSDKDTLQLVDEDTVVFSPYKDEGIIYDEVKVLEHFGVRPQGVTDLIALMGDDADNIPGVHGIGEKTAVALIKAHGSLENLLNNIDVMKQDKVKKAIIDNLDKIRLNKELAVLDKEIDLDFNLDGLRLRQADSKELFRLFKHLEFKALLKNLHIDENQPQKIETVAKYEDEELKDLFSRRDELILHLGDASDNIVFYTKKKLFYSDLNCAQLKSALSNLDIRKVSHDLKRVKVFLNKRGISLEGLYFDTMIAAYLINPSKSEYTLSSLAWDYLGEAVGAGPLDSSRAAEFMLKLKPILEKELTDKSLLALFDDIEMPLIEVLADMELNGIKLDLKIMEELSMDIEKKLIKLIEDIYLLAGVQFNLNSPKQLREVLFEKMKLPVIKKTKTGPSTDEEVLRALAQQHKLPELLLEYRQLTKIKNTYLDTLPELVSEHTGRIHSSFNQAATETGRLSSSNPNLQNIPVKTDIGKNIRRAIIASGEDSCLLSCDYSQIELRVLAHICHDENLIAAFKEDKDIHKATASLIYGLDEMDVADYMRDVAKRVNFGIIYGLTFYGLSRDLGISVEEAQIFIDAYFLRYPKVKEYIENQIRTAKNDGFVTTILGRRRYLPEINNPNQAIQQFAQRQAVNTPIQGTASDLIKLAMIAIHSYIRNKGLGAKMILQIHDELVFDVPMREMGLFVDLVKDKMENVLKLDVPIKVDIKKGRNWLEMEPAIKGKS